MTKPVYSIPSFCDDHHLSKAFLYNLIKKGSGPRLMKIGRRTLISAEAAAEWREAMQVATSQNAKSFWEA